VPTRDEKAGFARGRDIPGIRQMVTGRAMGGWRIIDVPYPRGAQATIKRPQLAPSWGRSRLGQGNEPYFGGRSRLAKVSRRPALFAASTFSGPVAWTAPAHHGQLALIARVAHYRGVIRKQRPAFGGRLPSSVDDLEERDDRGLVRSYGI
jgi:hypothetical protein